MRRKDREITALPDILEIIDRCEVCRIGFTDGKMPYIVPMNFGYTCSEDGTLRFYFHCAAEGRKLTLLRENPQVCFELDRPIAFLPGDIPSQATYTYESVMGEGVAEIVSDPNEKKAALDHLMRHYMGEGSFEYTPSCMDAVTIFMVTSRSFTAKRGLK